MGTRNEGSEHGVVEVPDVTHRLIDGHMKNRPAPQQFVDPHADEEGRLAHTVPCDESPHVADPETAVQSILKQAHRASSIHELAIHGGAPDQREAMLIDPSLFFVGDLGFVLLLEFLLNLSRCGEVLGELHGELSFALGHGT